MKETIEVLEDLIRIDSRNPFRVEKPNPEDPSTWRFHGNEAKISDYLENLLNESGFKVRRTYAHTDPDGKEFQNLLAEKGTGNKSILFYGHMDTVTANPWKSEEDALTPRRDSRNGKEILLGLGSNDMKAGLAVMATAFKDINPKDCKIKIAFGVDEEYYSLGANAFKTHGHEFFEDVRAIIVPEIGDGPNHTYGPQTIGLGRLGRCEYIIKIPGTGGHGAQSENPEFINAATESAKLYLAIAKKRSEFKDLLTFCSKSPGETHNNQITGGFLQTRLEAGDGTLSVPARGEIVVDWTFTPNYTLKQAEKYLKEIIEDLYTQEELRKTYISGEFRKIEVARRKRPTEASNAYVTEENHPFTKFVRDAIDRTIGFRNYNFGYSVADENVFGRLFPKIPILVIGPRGDDSHKAGEWVEIDSVRKLSTVYQEIARTFGQYKH